MGIELTVRFLAESHDVTHNAVLPARGRLRCKLERALLTRRSFLEAVLLSSVRLALVVMNKHSMSDQKFRNEARKRQKRERKAVKRLARRQQQRKPAENPA